MKENKKEIWRVISLWRKEKGKNKIKWRGIGALLSSLWLVHPSFSSVHFFFFSLFPENFSSSSSLELVHPPWCTQAKLVLSGIPQLAPFFFLKWELVGVGVMLEGGQNAGSATIWQRRWCITQSFWAILRSKDDAFGVRRFSFAAARRRKKTNINLYHTLSLSYRSTGKNLGLSENRGQQFALDRYISIYSSYFLILLRIVFFFSLSVLFP